jgi:hypothetical protein
MAEYSFPTEMVSLPSKGWFYDTKNPLASGEIEIKYMTAREEDIYLISISPLASGFFVS